MSMFSIPRDLYYRNSKVNTIYRKYGPRILADSIEKFTGIPIEHYAVVEMHAFVDLVDVLGGIDVVLDEPLMDPTYRIRSESGQWTTLYYPAGKHHLDGISALRVARARHFTPVFSRDMRQQKILLAIRDRIQNMGLKDIGTAGKIIRLSMRYVDTDMTWLEALSLFRDVQKMNGYGSYVISSYNVLYATYTNLLHTGLTLHQVGADFDKGAWILVPIDNNWNLIKKFIYEKIFS